MRYWGILLLKLLGVYLVLHGLWAAMMWLLPTSTPIVYHRFQPFEHDLAWSLSWAMAVLFLFICGLGILYVALWDQQLRCRDCGRRLRMPLMCGSYSNLLQEGRPEYEYICAFGHGSLRVQGTKFQGREPSHWRSNKDLWTHLIAADRAGR